MTQNIIAIDAGDVKCTECGNENPARFTTITAPYIRDNRIVGYTVSGITCKRCGTSMGFDFDVKNTAWR